METAAVYPYSFFVELLPDLDAGYLNDQIDYSVGPFNTTVSTTKFQQDGTTGRINNDTLGSSIPILRCPSSQTDGFSQATDYTATTSGAGPALTSYKPVSATDSATMATPTNITTPVVANGVKGMGLISPYKANRAQSSSLTILMAETDEDSYAAWADGATVGIWGSTADLTPDIDDSANRTAANPEWNAAGFNGATGVIDKGVSSGHPNTVNVALGDGSARTIDKGIAPQAWNAFITLDPSDNTFASQHIAESQ